MKKKKLIAVFLSLALMASVVTGCGNSQGGAGDSQTPAEEKNVEANTGEAGDTEAEDVSSEELVTIRVSTLAQQLSIPMHYISKMGWDVENGFKLEITTFAQGSGINEALGSGLVDVFTIGAAGVSSCSVY